MPRRLSRCSGWRCAAVEISLLAWAVSSLGAATNYTMKVRLDPQTRILHGEAGIEWTNQSPVEVSSLCLHQYYNAWKDADSSFLNSNRMTQRDFSAWKEDEWAYSDIQRLAVDGVVVEADLSEVLHYLSREDGNPLDRTAVEFTLTHPIAPQETIRLDVGFQARVPRTFARTGFRGDYFFIAQWFPKMGVLQDDGTWHCQQFIQTEFFSDFGAYDVTIEVPEGWIVGATGESDPISPLGDGYASHRFRQDQVHDFAWTTSPHFQVVEDHFQHEGLPEVELRLLLMPDHADQSGRYLEAVKAGLRYYGEWFGAYPYRQLTIVDPAYRSRTGGMEYPTLFTGGTRWWNPAGSGDPESVTIHEFGHQIWYGVVANNEFDHAWLDEGFNSYSTARVLRATYGSPRLVRRYLDGLAAYAFPDIDTVRETIVGTGDFYSEMKLDRMDTPSYRYGPASGRYSSEEPSQERVYGSGAYGINSYDKPALMLDTLEAHLGWEVMQPVLSTYFERFRFRHPEPADFFAVAEEVSGQNLDWFWEQTYRSSEVFDYAVDRVAADGDRHQVVIRRWGEGQFPQEVEVLFESGSLVVEKWDGRERWKRFDFIVEDDRIIRVVVDPRKILALDVNPVNNSWVETDSSRFAGWKWGVKWMVWFQNLIQFYAALG